jgi:hypothetical protein
VTVVAKEAEAELPPAGAPHGAPCHHGVVPVCRRGGERRGLLKVGPRAGGGAREGSRWALASAGMEPWRPHGAPREDEEKDDNWLCGLWRFR